jgi:hypothetical protein
VCPRLRNSTTVQEPIIPAGPIIATRDLGDISLEKKVLGVGFSGVPQGLRMSAMRGKTLR